MITQFTCYVFNFFFFFTFIEEFILIFIIIILQDPVDLPAAKLIINKYRQKCRMQTEQILAWKKAYNLQRQQHHSIGQMKSDQLNMLTSQLFLLESRLKRKQRNIANILIESECTILRQQRIIDTLSSRLIDYKLDSVDGGSRFSATDLENLNDSDSAVVLEDIDSDSNTSASIILRRKNFHSSSGDVTIVRSISDAIETSLNKYSVSGGGGGGCNSRRTNCYLRRPDILETVYSVEEDPEPDASEKRDNFKNQSKNGFKCMTNADDVENKSDNGLPQSVSHEESPPSVEKRNGTQVVNYNRVMSNHRSVTKPKDVKYKRINKAKSKSLEELRGRLKHWVDKGNIELIDAHKQAQSYV